MDADRAAELRQKIERRCARNRKSLKKCTEAGKKPCDLQETELAICEAELVCPKEAKELSTCLRSIMSVGQYNGQPSCAAFLTAAKRCTERELGSA